MNALLSRTATEPDYRARFTTREFLAMGQADFFADMRMELVHGELERMNPPMSAHGRMQADLVFQLKTILAGRRDREVIAEVGIDLGEDTVLGCDVAVATAIDGNRMLRPDDLLLVIEIAATTLARDMGMKRREYGRAGIPNYWVVDIDRRLLHRFAEPTDGEYLALGSLHFSESVPVPGSDGAIILD